MASAGRLIRLWPIARHFQHTDLSSKASIIVQYEKKDTLVEQEDSDSYANIRG